MCNRLHSGDFFFFFFLETVISRQSYRLLSDRHWQIPLPTFLLALGFVLFLHGLKDTLAFIFGFGLMRTTSTSSAEKEIDSAPLGRFPASLSFRVSGCALVWINTSSCVSRLRYCQQRPRGPMHWVSNASTSLCLKQVDTQGNFLGYLPYYITLVLVVGCQLSIITFFQQRYDIRNKLWLRQFPAQLSNHNFQLIHTLLDCEGNVVKVPNAGTGIAVSFLYYTLVWYRSCCTAYSHW